MLINTNYAEENDTSFLQISLQNDIRSLAKKKMTYVTKFRPTTLKQELKNDSN